MTASPLQQQFVTQLAARTGLAPAVIDSWANREGAYAPNGTGGFNFLNLRPAPGGKSYSGVPLAGVSPGNFAQFSNLNDAVNETAYWLNKMPNYQGVRNAVKAGADPSAQWKAITASPWDAGHYGNSTLPTQPSTPPVAGAPGSTIQPPGPSLTLTTQQPNSPLADPLVQQVLTSNDKLLGIQAPNFAALAPKPTVTPTISTPNPIAEPKHTTVGTTGQLSYRIVGHETTAAKNAISLAEDYLGTPYVWGGDKPGGFDCSGLLQYVWHRAGVSIPRTTYDQFRYGQPVSKSKLQPGDAVFFTGSDPMNGLPGHVAMYIGNGKVIQAPHTGADVEITSLNSIPGFQGARRFA